MAAASHLYSIHLCSSNHVTVSRNRYLPLPCPSTPRHPQRRSNLPLRICSGAGDLGDFGARDPFPAEIESQFGDKVLGSGDTTHKILIPNASALSLSNLNCTPIPHPQPPMSMADAKSLLNKVIGWRLVDGQGGIRLQCLWKLRDLACGIELINRIYNAVEATGHFPDIHWEQPNQVRAELWTSSIGGLSLNDFIVAAKIDEIKTADLIPRKRVWA